MTITLDKEGTFVGKAVNEYRTYPYKVSIRADSRHLNESGYIIENSKIQDYFDKLHPKTDCHAGASRHYPSCEGLACQAAQEIANLVEKCGAEVEAITVSIGGSNETRLTAVYEPKTIK